MPVLSLWFYLWLLLSAALLYFLGWTMFILYRQKRAWKMYAQKRKMRYRSESFFRSPEISGVVDGYTVSIFTGEHGSEDARSLRKLTAIEVSLETMAPVSMGAASGGMVEVIRGLGFANEVKPAHKDWQDSYIAAGENINVLNGYFTDERIASLASLMKIKNGWVTLVFHKDVKILRFDTPNALDDPKKLDMIIKKMVETAKLMEISSAEAKVLKADALKRPKRAAAINVANKDIESPVGFEFEEDEGEPDSVENNEADDDKSAEDNEDLD